MKKKLLLATFSLIMTTLTASASIPIGYYYSANGKNKAELKTALSHICQRVDLITYGTGTNSTWAAFYELDQLTDGSVWDIYSNTVRYFDPAQPLLNIPGMHIDHAFAKENWGYLEQSAARDLHNLFPADGETNVTKNHYPLGIVLAPIFNNGLSKFGPNSIASSSLYAFEPDDEYKGDFARAYLYMSVMYEDFSNLWTWEMMNNNSYPTWKPWAIDLLLQWHRQDPVSAKEIARNDGIFALQGNRNPFIDYPNLIEYIWGTDTASLFQFPVETEPFLFTPHSLDQINFG